MSMKAEDFVKCPREDCIHNVGTEGGKYCETVEQLFVGECPFYRTFVKETLEQGALHTLPAPDWETFRRHSETKPVTAKRIAEWLAKMEEVCPTTDPATAKLVTDFICGRKQVIAVSEAIRKVADWLEFHKEGCGWAMSPQETARMILEGDDDQSD